MLVYSMQIRPELYPLGLGGVRYKLSKERIKEKKNNASTQEICQFWFGTQAQHSIPWLGTSQIMPTTHVNIMKLTQHKNPSKLSVKLI